jgi:hypothetical protein
MSKGISQDAENEFQAMIEKRRSSVRIPKAKPRKKPRKKSAGPVGVGGWLKFFAIMLLVLHPLIGTSQMVSGWYQINLTPVPELYPGFMDVMWLENAATALMIAIGLVCGTLILSGHRSGKKAAFTYLTIVAILKIIVYVRAQSEMPSMPQDIRLVMQNEFNAGLIVALCWLTVWTLYFMFSKRVRNAYDQPETPYNVAPDETSF